MRANRILVMLLAVVVLAVASSGCGQAPPAAQPKPQPAPAPALVTLVLATVAQPSTLDGHWTTADATHNICYQTHETLLSIDDNYRVIPMLAEGYSVSRDGLTVTIPLRKGVKFHNGKEMTADDVVASIGRWGKRTGPGKQLFANLNSFVATDKYTIVISLKKPSAAVIPFLGIQEANPWIYPKESIDAAGDGQLKEFFGTGPFKFVEYKPDQHTRLEKFKDYVPRAEKATGMGGKKEALVDVIMMRYLADPSVRAAAVEAGEAHYAEAVNYDDYNRFLNSTKAKPVVVMPRLTIFARHNMKAGPMANEKIRQAFQLALDSDDIMKNTIGVSALYSCTPSILNAKGPWGNSTAGAEVYNKKDYARAQQLLKEAKYDGKPIRWITSKQYPYMYASAMATKPHLEKAGFKVDIQVLEWAQLVNVRAKETEWDVFSTGIANVGDPSLHIILDASWPGWWASKEKDRFVQDLWNAPTEQDRVKVWGEFQKMYYKEAPLATMGQSGTLHLISPKLKGFVAHTKPFFWNVSIEK